MALTVDEIAEILNTMRVENEHNVENFQKVLTGINNKIELMAEDNEATDLIKLYISELKKSVEDRHNDANSRFSGIENSLDNILSSQNNGAKTSEIIDLSKVVSASFNAMSDEFSHQENALNELDSKLDLIKTNSFNKDELAGLLSNFASDLSQMSSDVEKSFGKIENSLTEALEKINDLDFSSQISSIDSKITSLSENIDAIPSKISFANLEDKISYFQNIVESLRGVITEVPALSAQAVSKQFSELENSFENIVSEEDFSAFKDNLFDYIRQLNDSTVIVSTSISANREKIENILSVIDSLDYKNNFSEISDRIHELEDAVKGISQNNAYEIQNLEKTLSSVVTDSDFAGFKSDLANFVQKIIDNSTALNSELSYSTERIENILTTINSMDYTQDFDRITKEMAELESVVNENIAGIEKNINTSISDISENVLKKLDDLEISLSTIVSDSDFAGFKSDLADFVQKIIDNSTALNSELSYSAERIENILTTVKALDFRDDFVGIENRINDLKEAFDEGAKVNYTNLSEQISAIKALLDREFEDIDNSRQSVYNDLKNNLDAILLNIQTVLNSNPQKSIDELSALVMNLSGVASELRKGISNDIQGDYGDVKSSINAVAIALQAAKDDIINKNNEFYSSSSNDILSLQDKIDVQIKALDDIKNSVNDDNRFDISEITSSIENINNEISSIIADLKEDSSSNYEAIKAYVDELASAIQSNHEEFLNVASKNSNLLSTKLDVIASDVSDFKEEFKQTISANVGNFSMISENVNGISQKLEKFQNDFTENSTENVNSLKLLLDEMSKKLSEDIEYQKKMFSEESQEEDKKRLEAVQKLTSDVQKIEDLLSSNNETYKLVADESIKNIREYIKELSDSLYSSQQEGVSKFNAKLETLDVLSHGFETFVTSLNEQVQKVLYEIQSLDSTKQNNEIQAELNDLKLLCEGLLTSINDILGRNDKLSSVVSSLMEIVLKKDDINEISFKMDEYSDILKELKEFIEGSFASNSSEINSLYEKVEMSFENIVSREDFVEFKNELSKFLEKVTDNSNILNSDIKFNQEKLAKIQDSISSIEPSDYSYEFTQIASKIDDLSIMFSSSASSNYEGISTKLDEIKSQIEENNKDEKVVNKLDEFSELMNSLKTSISQSVAQSVEANSKSINEQFEKFENSFSKIVTEDDFTNFRTDFGDFIQKILDNADVLHFNSDATKEQINSILDKLNELNYSENFANLNNKLDEIHSSFENISKTNCGNIVTEINSLKSLLDESFAKNSDLDKENYDKLVFSLAAITDNVEILMDLSTHKPVEIVDKVSEQISNVVLEINENIKSGNKLNLEELKQTILNITNELNTLKQAFEDKTDNLTFSLTSGFDNVKLSLENILVAFNSLNDALKDGYEKNSKDVIDSVENAAEKIDELKNEIHQFTTDYSDRVYNIVNEISDKLEGISTGVAQGVNSQIDEVKNSVAEISENLEKLVGEYFTQLKDANDVQSTEINGISENINDFKSHVDETIQSLKDYVTELNVAAKSSKSLSDSKFSEKLVNLEAALISNAESYEQKVGLLNEKLAEFVGVVENSSSTTDEKIASSIDEINSMKEEFSSLAELLNTIKQSADEKSSQMISLLDTNIEHVTESVNEITNGAIKNIDASISQNISSIEEKLSNLLNVVEGLKDTNLDEFAESLNDKISELKQELELINTDISGALQNKAEDIIGAIEPIKAAIDDFSLDSEFAKLLEDIKSELETSFMNFSVDVNGELSAHSESVLRLEQAFKETYNKVSVIEDCVSEDIKNSIELLNVTVETNTRNLKCGLEEKLDEYINDLKAHLDLVINDTKTLDSIDNLRDELSVKLDSVISEQENLAQQNNVISAGITTLGDDLKNYVQSACENTIDKYSPIQHKEAVDLLNQKVDALVESTSDEEIIDILDQLEQKTEKYGMDLSGAVNSIKDKIDLIENDDSISTELKALSDKIDIIATDASVDELQEKFDEFSSKLDSFTEDDSIENAIKALSEKIDIIATDTSVEELHEKFDDFSSEEDKISEMLATLHEKVDAIALDGADFDIEEEIDDIKSLIFEQRKYFEASSDEKAAAIDKYLRDVLMKLDNVDLEKNSEDIKDSIINTLVSLFEQISFVEESEDIKDFVEEKTDEINQNLIEVQNQLKQITNPSDDFDYSYTLQDVESDIAKLRVAINNISDSNFENISDDIKKIVSSVEGLESTLTQDQIVDLKGDIEKLNEDILSISSRTNKLLLTSDESYKALNDGLNNFSSLVYKLEDRINYLDNSEVSERLERKIDNIQSMAVASANADKVFHQVMMYLGEWIDSTTENITSITEKTSEISKIKKNLEELKDAIPEKSDILDEIENKFEEQESRIDRLEMKLEKILSTLEEKDNMMLNRKVDKIEKMLSRLGTNIEKLASYVDEE